MTIPIKYLSVCSGIEAATVAWSPLGFQAVGFAEIDPFCRAVLKHHYPDTPLHSDFTKLEASDVGPTDILVGGTPCQSFSVAGLRKGLDDDRGNLTLEFLRLAARLRPRWVVWENVPGVLSIDGGRAFGAFLGGLGECGYGFAYRILDAQHFGVPQRRRRVFVIGYFGDWRRAAAVLFEPESLRGDITPRREAGEEIAGTLGGGSGSRGYNNSPDVAGAFIPELRSVAALTSCGVGTCGADDNQAQAGRIIAFAQNTRDEVRLLGGDGKIAGALAAQPGMKQQTFVAFAQNQLGEVRIGNIANTINTNSNASGRNTPMVAYGDMQKLAVRRLTSVECERLQGFPDNYTLVPYRGKPAADGPRYKALGNSMAVPVMRWIGERIALAEAL